MFVKEVIEVSYRYSYNSHYYTFWPKANGGFSKSAPGTSSFCRLYNNDVKDTQGNG